MAATAAMFVASGASAATMVDQSYITTGLGNALTIDNNVAARAQSFTVGLDGFLTGVRLRLSDHGTFGPTAEGTELTVGIYDVSGDTIDISGGPLTSTVATPDLGSAFFNDWKIFETSFASSVPVSVGDTLAIVLSDVDAVQNEGFRWVSTGSPGYTGGRLWQIGAGDVLTPNNLGSDHNFETLVSTTPPDPLTPIPLPAALPLLLAGLGAFGVMRRRRG